MIAALPVAGFALSGMAQAIGGLYGVIGDMNAWMDKHIQDMQTSDNDTISRTGRVLEGAKLGFCLGYAVPVTVIAVGQYLLGNTLTAVVTIGSAATFTNPIAMTCAAVGAIYYGWNALSDDERGEALDKLSNGLEIGIELIRSVIRYVVEGLSNLMTSKHLIEFKEYISVGAKRFGKTLYDVTHDVSDKLSQLWTSATDAIAETFDKSKESVKQSSEAMMQGIGQIKDAASMALDDATSKARETTKQISGSFNKE